MSSPYQPDPRELPPLPPGAPVPPPSGAHLGGQPGPAPVPSTPSTAPTRQDRPFSNKQIAAAVLALIAVVFMAENTRSAKVRLLIPEVTVPLFLVILVSLAVGALVTFLLMWRKHRDEERRRTSARRPR